MRKLRKVKKILSWAMMILSLCILSCLLAMQIFPDQVSKFIGYRYYAVLSGSMEPTIPTYSLVVSKLIDKEAYIEPDTIITFHANILGDDILLTHYYRHTQLGSDGHRYYRTQPEGDHPLDSYETRRGDIIGTYVFHIPYVGKVFLYLKSPFGFVMYGELLLIFLINQICKERFMKKDKMNDEIHFHKKRRTAKPVILMKRLSMTKEDEGLIFRGTLVNMFDYPIHFVKMCFTFYDVNETIVFQEKWFVVGSKVLLPKQSHDWQFILPEQKNIDHYELDIVSSRKIKGK